MRRTFLMAALCAGATTPAPAHAQSLPAAATSASAPVARIVVATDAYTRPRRDARVRLRLSPLSVRARDIQRLPVIASRADVDGRRWLQVALPVRPNGSTGWIDADDAVVTRTPWRVAVDLSRREVRVYRYGHLQRRFSAVIGSKQTPTPRGHFAVYEKARQRDPGGFIGPWALHLTAHSDVLTNYGGGPGRVAIHGRAGASLSTPLGAAASHGCVRVENRHVRWMARVLDAGTPVRIS